MSDKRLAFLENLTKSGSNDPMAWYGLAMEYKARERVSEALDTFTRLRASHPEYVAMYLMCGDMLRLAGKRTEAKEWLDAGIERARVKRDAHALSELETALAGLLAEEPK